MAKFTLYGTPTSEILRVKILDSSATDGSGLTGLTFSSAGLIISTIKIGEASATAYTQAGGTIETISTLGTYATPTASKCRFKEVDATNHPGWYEIHFADARYASTTQLGVTISGATDCAETDLEVQIGSVTVGTNNDKTGYTVSTVSDKTGYSLAADQSGVTIGTVTTNTDMRGTDSANTTKTGYSLASDQSGVTIGTVTDITNDVTTDSASRTASKADVSALALASELAKIKGAVAGKVATNAAGTQVLMYDFSGSLLVTLDKSGSDPVIWTPTWA